MAGSLLKDADWVRQSFLVGIDSKGKLLMDDVDIQNRIFTTASLKFTDTTPGGNFAINPPPQFTRHADIRAPGRYTGPSKLMTNHGQGRYYSEAIDDHSQLVNIRFGVPQFNSLTTFFTGFYNTGAGQLARTGRSTNIFYAIGKAIGFVVSILSFRLLAVHALGVGYRFLAKKPSSKFYYLKPTMPLYWNAVTTMVNQIAVNTGIVPRIGGAPQQELNDKYEFDEAALTNMHNLLPDIFTKGGGIDVYALANRAQRLASIHHTEMNAAADAATNLNLKTRMDELAKQYQGVLGKTTPDGSTKPLEDTGSHTLQEYLAAWFATAQSVPPPTKGDDKAATAKKPPTLGTEEVSAGGPDAPEAAGYDKFLKAEYNDGSQFATFRVNSTGHVSESFSNQTQDSEIQSKINGISASARSTHFSFGNGNLIGGAFGAAIGAVATGVKDVVSGAMDALSISGLAALNGSAFVDIPKHWQSSSAKLPTASYTINLVSPYGNPMSQLLNLHIPLAMLLAGALPLSTGKQSYTSPFLCELYDRGRCQTRLGIIDAITITRGVGNLGFNSEGKTMGIDVTFSVMDLSSVLHMPISESFTMGVGTLIAARFGDLVGGDTGARIAASVANAPQLVTEAVQGTFDDDNIFNDYMAVISGMGLADQIYQIRKGKLNLTRQLANWESWSSPSHFASFAGDTLPARMISAIYKGTAR